MLSAYLQAHGIIVKRRNYGRFSSGTISKKTVTIPLFGVDNGYYCENMQLWYASSLLALPKNCYNPFVWGKKRVKSRAESNHTPRAIINAIYIPTSYIWLPCLKDDISPVARVDIYSDQPRMPLALVSWVPISGVECYILEWHQR